MEAISTHNTALLALLKRIFLQNTQPVPTAHSRGWKLKGFSLFSAFIFLIGLNGWGQSYATLGTAGTGSQYASVGPDPYRHYYTDFRGQYIFTVAELTSAGLSAGSQVSAISFYVRTKYSTGSIENFTISLAHTATSNFSSGFLAPSFTTCYTGNVTTVANSWNTHTFTTNFTWNGTSNIIVQSCFDDNSYSASDQYWYQITSGKVHYNYADGASGCSMANNSNDTWRPVTRFTYTNCTPQTTYYSKSSGNLDDVATWGSSSDGTGCSPANFTTAGVTYIIQNNATPTTSGVWAVSGTGSIVKVGNASSAITFTAGGNLTFTCDLEITGNATLSLGSNNMTLSGDFVRSASTAGFSQTAGSASTVTFSGSSQEVNVTALNGTTPTDSDITFNHVTIDGASVKLFYFKTNDRKLNINNFTVNSGKVVTLYSNPQ